LIITHPHEAYDHGHNREEIIDAVTNFDGYTCVIPYIGGIRGERIYGGSEIYDEVLFEGELGGTLNERDAERLSIQYDEILLGGGKATECLRNTHLSLSKPAISEGVGLGIVPSITYDQSWNRPEGFLLSEVIEVAQKKEDEEAEKLIDKYLGQFNDGNTRLAHL